MPSFHSDNPLLEGSRHGVVANKGARQRSLVVKVVLGLHRVLVMVVRAAIVTATSISIAIGLQELECVQQLELVVVTLLGRRLLHILLHHMVHIPQDLIVDALQHRNFQN